MGRKLDYTPRAHYNEIVKLRCDGHRIAEISSHLHCSITHVRNVLQHSGLGTQRIKLRKTWPYADELLKLYAEGWTYAALAAHFYISEAQVYLVLRYYDRLRRPHKRTLRKKEC